MVEEVRRQFREIPGLMEGTGKPDTRRCVEISTAGALKEMGEREWNGQQCTVVTAEGSPVEFYLNQETKLIEGIAVPGTPQVIA